MVRFYVNFYFFQKPLLLGGENICCTLYNEKDAICIQFTDPKAKSVSEFSSLQSLQQ